MQSPLVPCPACQRHVRADEARCPFCEGALPSDLARHAIPGVTTRLGRAALAVFATGLVGVACGGTPASSDPGGQGGGGSSGGQVNDNGAMVALYGAPVEPYPSPVADAGERSGEPEDAALVAQPPRPGGPNDQGNIRPMYGVPPKPEGD